MTLKTNTDKARRRLQVHHVESTCLWSNWDNDDSSPVICEQFHHQTIFGVILHATVHCLPVCLSVSLCVWLRNWSRQHTRAQEWVVWWQIQQKQIAENLRSRWWIVWWRTTSDISNVYVWCWTISTQSMFTAPGASAGYKYKAIRTAWPTKSLQTIRLESGIHHVTYIMLHI